MSNVSTTQTLLPLPPQHNILSLYAVLPSESYCQIYSIMGGWNEQASISSRNSIRVVRTVRKIHKNQHAPTFEETSSNTVDNNEVESNADTCYLGQNFVPISYTNQMADIYSYDRSYFPITNVPIITGTIVYDHSDGNTYILIFNEELYYSDKSPHSLINTNQVWHQGLDFWDNLYDPKNSFSIVTNCGLVVPISYHCTKLIFKRRTSTMREWFNCQHI